MIATYTFNADDLPGARNNYSQIIIISLIILAIVAIAFVFYIKKLSKKSLPKGSGEIKSIKATFLDSKKENIGGIGYITKYIFEDETGQRIVLVIKPQDAECLVVGDKGMLTYQGAKYISFTR